MKTLRRQSCDGSQCRKSPFFHSTQARSNGDAFFNSISAAGDTPALQRQEAPAASAEEKKEPLPEGLKTTAEKLAEHEPFKKWYEPQVNQLKLTLWDKASPADKAAMLSFLGINLGIGGAAFASSPELRRLLSDVNFGKLLSLIPLSPIEGFKYKLPDAGKTATGFSADFTLTPYLSALRRRGIPLTGANFGLESSYDPAGQGFGLTGGKFGLEFFGGALKAEGKTFNSLSQYPQLMHGRDGMPPSWLMQETPGMLDRQTGPGFQFMLNADLLQLIPDLKKHF